MRLALAQFNATVGDLAGNSGRILELARAARAGGAGLMLTPELALCGYPPEDLALRPDFYRESVRQLTALAAALPADLVVVAGFPEAEEDRRYNAAAILRDGRVTALYRKQRLANYAVFDELRTFAPGDAACVFELDGIRFGLNICADVWEPGPAAQARAAGADALLVLNASPFHLRKEGERQRVLRERIDETGLAMVYLNLVGGQDELVFDGASFAMDGEGRIAAQYPAFAEGLFWLDIERGADGRLHLHGDHSELPVDEEALYAALVTGVRDYVAKNGFPGALVGLSGGIDSALTLCIAVDALGAARVHAVMMPSPYTADISLADAAKLAANLGVRYDVESIGPVFDAYLATLAPAFAGHSPDLAEENIQARIRGTLLMALSNKFGKLVLTTGNKSEMAVGYATLYGDMAGGLAVLKDVTKTWVWRLARWRNRHAEIIPERIITRPPSAELRPDQTDQDSLPPYEELDAILERYVERDQSPAEIIAAGHAADTVAKVVRLIDRAEYKRRQSPPGLRVTPRGFGRDRRYPITNRYPAPFREGDPPEVKP